MTQWLLNEHTTLHHEPPDELVLHVSTCAHCRGALLTLLVNQVGQSNPLDERQCDDIADDLPEFVDYEQHYGTLQAIQTYPDIWWHILVCSDCNELYHTLADLAVLPQIAWNEQTVVPLRPQAGFRAQLTIHVTTLRQFLSLQSSLGAAWGETDDGIIVAEHREEAYLLQVALRYGALGTFMLVVTTKPPITGVARLQLRGEPIQVDFDDKGCAVFDRLEAADFEETSASDLHLVIESPRPAPPIDGNTSDPDRMPGA